MKVFVTDDSRVFRKYLIEMLCELEGVEIVGQADDAQEALEAIRVLPPDVVTLDVNILGGSGIEVLMKIKKDRLAPVVIMLTNHSSLPYRKKCMQAKVLDHTGGNKQASARLLEIDRKTLDRMIKRHKLSPQKRN